MLKRFLKKGCINQKGFSLVELIVVIAIMAVMAAVLAPALLGYVEKSRMQKDDSAMDEVVNAMQLSLADQEIYDEVLEHSVWDNVSCYIDQKEESKFASHKVTLKAANGDKKEQYMFGDDARLLDETVYYAAGNMRGLTITWSPNESGDTYDFSKGILNKFVGRKTGILSENPELYNRLRSVIGDKLDTTSQTYRNSDYTIFIRVGSTGGSEAVMQDAIQVWGQFNGTNLAEKDHKFELSSGRVVGAAGAQDESRNQSNNSNETIPDFSESSAANNELTTLSNKTWKGLDRVYGSCTWTDGSNIYHSNGSTHYILNEDTWVPTTFTGIRNFHSGQVWTDGNKTYYSSGSEQYELDGNTWKEKQWNGFVPTNGSRVWTDGTNIYYSQDTQQYVLQNGEWQTKEWDGLTSFDGMSIFHCNGKIYYFQPSLWKCYILNDNRWEEKTLNSDAIDSSQASILGGSYSGYVWSDGVNVYFSFYDHFVLRGDTWEKKTWNGTNDWTGNQTWTDGTNMYFSYYGYEKESYVFS